MSIPPLDRVMVLSLVMAELLADGARATGDLEEVGSARIVLEVEGRVAGIAVAKEAFGRLGARLRPLVEEGSLGRRGDAVAELGGPLAAMRAAAPTALRLLRHLSGVASGVEVPDPADPLDAWAATFARLSPPPPVGDDSPSFHLEIEG